MIDLARRDIHSHAVCSDIARVSDVPMPDQIDDSALMLRYCDGDLKAFEQLYQRHNDALYRYLLRLSKSNNTADDVFQETWAKIIKARKQYRPTAKFTTYLFRVARNCFIDYLRRNSKHQLAEALEPDEQASLEPGPEQNTDLQYARAKLNDILDDLPIEQREVFLLREEAGMSLNEIASTTGTNPETAKSRLRYANHKLRNALKDLTNNDGASQHA